MVVPMKLIVMTLMMVIMMTKMIMMDLPGQTDEVLGQRGLPRCNPCNLLNPANG